MIQRFHVVWEIDIYAETPREAAEQAFATMQRAGTSAADDRSTTGVMLATDGENFRIMVHNVNALSEAQMVNALSARIRRDSLNGVDGKTGNKIKRKTAKIEVHHVFGTKSTTAYRVEYRGKLLKTEMGNETAQAMCDKARKWAHENGFTHCEVSYG